MIKMGDGRWAMGDGPSLLYYLETLLNSSRNRHPAWRRLVETAAFAHERRARSTLHGAFSSTDNALHEHASLTELPLGSSAASHVDHASLKKIEYDNNPILTMTSIASTAPS